jgi:hypothetical protein
MIKSFTVTRLRNAADRSRASCLTASLRLVGIRA